MTTNRSWQLELINVHRHVRHSPDQMAKSMKHIVNLLFQYKNAVIDRGQDIVQGQVGFLVETSVNHCTGVFVSLTQSEC